MWKMKYSKIPGAEANNSKLALVIVVLGLISFAFYMLMPNFDWVTKTNYSWIPSGVKEYVEAKQRIAIVMIITRDTNPSVYQAAIQTARCYSQIHNYEFVFAVDQEYNCTHNDKFFRRHCAAAKILKMYDVIMFLDADIGIVNPNRTIEEFMVEGIDVTFYDRFYNWEIMAGSYIARNTQYSVDLLNGFADYEFKLPNSFHGTDNGALHIYLAEKLFPNSSIEIEICQKVYNKSKNYADLFTYEACIRAIFGSGTDFGKVRIMRKGTGWARDGWLTSMLWHPELDFMYHGLKTGQLRNTPTEVLKPVQMGRSHWYDFLAGPLDLSKCSPQNSTWSYDRRLIGDKDEIRKSLKKFQAEVAVNQVNSYSRMAELLKR